MLLIKNFAPTNTHDKKNKQMASSPQQLLNEQEMQRITRFKPECHGTRLGTFNVGSLCGRKTEVSKELRKGRVDVCCMQEARWKGQGARFVVLWAKGINCGGQEIMQDLKVLKFW